MRGAYRGRDGVLYHTLEEETAANTRYEQTRLMKEQNDLLRKQQQRADRERQNDILRAAVDRAREIEEEKNRQLLETIEKLNEMFQKIVQRHSGVMKEAGIGDPESYVIKMMEVYVEDEEELKQLEGLKVTQNISFKEILKRMEDNEKIIETEHWETDKEKISRMKQLREAIDERIKEAEKKWWEPLLIALFTGIGMMLGIWVIIVNDVEHVTPIILGGVVFEIGALSVYNSRIRKRISAFLTEYNELIENAFLKRETRKIIKLEKRRAENFNFKLECVLLEISEEFQEGNKVLEEQGINKKMPNFKWKYYQYPQEFIEYCNQKVRKKEQQEAKEKEKSGLDIFDDL